MATIIADTATVDPRAELDDHVQVGPYCLIGPEVRIGRGTCLVAHAVVLGRTTLGVDNLVHPFVVLGADPSRSATGHPGGRLDIGDANVFRESVTASCGLDPEGGPTRIGRNNVLSTRAIVGSSCRLGDRVTLAEAVVLGDEVEVGAHATLSAAANVHRRVTIGACGFVGAQARVHHDVPPYLLVDGQPARVRGLNLVGLRRSGRDKTRIDALREAYRLLFRAGLEVGPALDQLETSGHRTPEVEELAGFLRAQRAGRYGRAREGTGRPDLVLG